MIALPRTTWRKRAIQGKMKKTLKKIIAETKNLQNKTQKAKIEDEEDKVDS